MNTRRARIRSRGFSLMELLIVIAIILILVSIAIPMYNKVQMDARETGAIGDIDAINKAQVGYHNSHAKFAGAMAELCGSGAGGAQSKNPDLSGNICTGESHGYVFTITSTSPDAYAIDARPRTPGSSGRRFFFSDESTIIRQNDNNNEPANSNSPQIK